MRASKGAMGVCRPRTHPLSVPEDSCSSSGAAFVSAAKLKRAGKLDNSWQKPPEGVNFHRVGAKHGYRFG